MDGAELGRARVGLRLIVLIHVQTTLLAILEYRNIISSSVPRRAAEEPNSFKLVQGSEWRAVAARLTPRARAFNLAPGHSL